MALVANFTRVLAFNSTGGPNIQFQQGPGIHYKPVSCIAFHRRALLTKFNGGPASQVEKVPDVAENEAILHDIIEVMARRVPSFVTEEGTVGAT